EHGHDVVPVPSAATVTGSITSTLAITLTIRSPIPLFWQQLADARDQLGRGHVDLAVLAQDLQLDHAGVALARAEEDRDGHARTVRVLELLAELVVAAVDLRVDALRSQLVGEREV